MTDHSSLVETCAEWFFKKEKDTVALLTWAHSQTRSPQYSTPILVFSVLLLNATQKLPD